MNNRDGARSWFRSPGARVVAVAALCAVIGVAYWARAGADETMVATVTRGPLEARLTASGVLRPMQSITYRSPVPGRDVEIRELAPEGSRVNAGDVVARLDTTDLEAELARAAQEHRQATLDLQVAEGEREEADAEVQAVSVGEGALTVDEARSTLQRAERKAQRLRVEHDNLKPLLEKGYITRDELARTADQLEAAEEELLLVRRRVDIMVQLSHPREQKRAALALAQKTAQLGNVRQRVRELELRVSTLTNLIDGCTIRARTPGLVVYEENLTANPRRKLRVGDRVFATHGIVTIPEVDRMQAESSISESDMHRVRIGQAADVRVEAFPDLRLTGKVARVGTLASASALRPFDDKRFDLIIALDPSTADLRPDMTIRADVVIGARSDVLQVPVTAVFNHQGTRVVHVIGAAGTEMRRVDLGEANDRVVEIVAGVSEGERVSLLPPVSLAPAAAFAPRPNALQPR